MMNKHLFTCPQCGHRDHADSNAAKNIRDRFTVLRDGALLSLSAAARAFAEGKPLSKVRGQ